MFTLPKAVIPFLFVFLSSCTEALPLSGKVVAIADGDTFTLLTADRKMVKIRMHGIDCPEKKQPYGKVAKDFTSAAIFGKPVTVDITGTDRYRRSIGIVHYSNNKVLNEELLKAGLAWHYIKYDKSAAWQQMERKAKAGLLGLWNADDAIAPWQWRKIK